MSVRYLFLLSIFSCNKFSNSLVLTFTLHFYIWNIWNKLSENGYLDRLQVVDLLSFTCTGHGYHLANPIVVEISCKLEPTDAQRTSRGRDPTKATCTTLSPHIKPSLVHSKPWKPQHVQCIFFIWILNLVKIPVRLAQTYPHMADYWQWVDVGVRSICGFHSKLCFTKYSTHGLDVCWFQFASDLKQCKLFHHKLYQTIYVWNSVHQKNLKFWLYTNSGGVYLINIYNSAILIVVYIGNQRLLWI